MKTNLQIIAEFITFLEVTFSVKGNSYILACNEEQYTTLSKVLLFYCTEFTVHSTVPVDEHFEVLYIEIDKKNIIL